MPTYEFLVIAENPRGHEVGTVVEVELKFSEYDAFKKQHEAYLERYMSAAPPFELNDTAGAMRKHGKFMERMDHIRHNYPGAKGMFDDARFRPNREW